MDDLAGNCNLLRCMLQHDGHHVTEAESGERALILELDCEADLILLAVVMHGMDGYTTCVALKRNTEDETHA